jgi:polysaccharide biosynthesis protein PslF
MFKERENEDQVLFMSTFPPRECGIATFTQDLTNAIDLQYQEEKETPILAINSNHTNIYNYSQKVSYQVSDDDIEDYIQTAKLINNSPRIKLVSIQHEFGLFGGEYGDHILAFLEILQKPTTITFHSIISRPNNRRKKVIKAISDRVQEIIVMTKSGVDILRNQYKVETPISIIPHGIPKVDYESQKSEKIKVGLEGRTILSSFGLISENKGYEYVIRSLPKVVQKFPSLLYVIVGQTHPQVRRYEGESYRNKLVKIVKRLDLKNHVKFYNKYVTKEEIIQYLKATDIYISPSLTKSQITSGTLVYALGCGRTVISTPFLHARDIITPERGALVKFRDPKSYTKSLIKLLEHKDRLKNMEKNAYTYTRHMTWDNVAKTYIKTFNNIITTPHPLAQEQDMKIPLN